MGFVADEIERGDGKTRSHRQANVLRPEALLQLRQQPVNSQGDDEEQIQAEEGDDVAHRVADFSDDAAEQHPQGPVIGHHRGGPDVPQGSLEVVRDRDGDLADHVALHVPYSAYHVRDGVYEAVGNHLRKRVGIKWPSKQMKKELFSSCF